MLLQEKAYIKSIIIHAFWNNILLNQYLILISFQFYNYMTVKLFTFTDSLYKFISLKEQRWMILLS